nr:reverse transcriptase domain-containing protein [Tanacetum cinerariifolium]
MSRVSIVLGYGFDKEDDDDGMECLPTEEIFIELARMGYEKPPLKLTFYKAFFSAKWKFLIHTLVQCLSAKRTAWNEFSCSMASAVICLATGRKFNISKYIFDSMAAAKEEDKEDETCTTLSNKIAALEQDKVAQALEILKLKRRVKKLEKQRRSKLEEKDEVNAAAKEVNAAEPTAFDDKEMQEKHLDNIRKCQSLKRKPISVAQARKNMIVYLKNMAGYKIAHFKGMTYDQVRPIFEREYNKVQTFLKPDRDEEPTKNRDTPTNDPKEISKEDVNNMLQIVLVSEFKVEALQVNFEDMMKDSDREDLDALWRLVKEKFSTTMPTEDKEKALWVELKRLYEPNVADGSCDEDLHGGQQTKEQKEFGYILQVIKKLELRKLNDLLEVEFLGHVINGDGIHVDPSKIEKCKTFDWGEEQENAFQTLKDKLCNAHVLALLDRPEDFVVYCDASGLGLGCVLMQRELLSDYDYEICYHPGKANVVADALSRKERVKPKRVRAMNMTLQSSIKDRMLAAQKEASDESAKWEGIDMDFMTKFHRTSSGHDTIWVIVDRLTKFSYFLPMHEDYKMDRLARLYPIEIVVRHGVSISIISDRDSRFTSRFWQSMLEALRTRLDISTAYHPQTDGQSEHTIQTLEDTLRACFLDFEGSWDVHHLLAEVGEGHLIGPELVQETTKKISHFKDRIKATQDRPKSYTNKRRKPL